MKTPLMRWRAFPLLTAATVLEKNIQSHLIGECTIFEESRFHFHGYMFISQNLDWTVIKQDDFLQFLLMGAYRCLLVNLNSKCAYWKCFNIHTCHVFCNGAATPHGKKQIQAGIRLLLLLSDHQFATILFLILLCSIGFFAERLGCQDSRHLLNFFGRSGFFVKMCKLLYEDHLHRRQPISLTSAENHWQI